MERMLVVVLDEEAKAYEASRALNQLDAEGSITIHAAGVVTKKADGTVTVTLRPNWLWQPSALSCAV